MKLKKESVKMLFLVLLWQAAMCSSNMAVPKSTKIVDVLKDRGEQDVSFNSKRATKKTLKDPVLSKDVSRLELAFAKRTTTINGNEANACSLGVDVFRQIYKFSTSEWIVDDNTIQLLHNDLQLLMDCTRPGERVIFSNTRTLKLARTLRITNKLEFIGKPLDASESSHTNSTVPSLTCPYSESGLSINATNFKATALRIQNCVSSSVSKKAAIVLERGSSATLNQLILKDNQNRAIFVNKYANLMLIESDLENNTVSNDGGAVYVEDYATIHIHRTNFKRNFVTDDLGGALYSDKHNDIIIKDSTFTDNACESIGGAIQLGYGGSIWVQGSVFTNNTSLDDAGAMFIDPYNKVHVEDSTFTNNTSGYWGGAIRVGGPSNVSIIKSKFADNVSKRAGGAIWLSSYNELSIRGSSFTNNTSRVDGGGAIFLKYRNALIIQESSFTNNTSKGNVGGAIRVLNYSTINIEASSFANNSCTSNGSAMHLDSKNTLIVQSTTISNNIANGNGGGIYMKANNTLIVYRSSLTSNVAMKNGGALQVLDNNQAFFVGCRLSRNKATNGGALNLGKHNTFSIERSTLSNNICTKYGSVLYLSAKNVVVGFDSFIANNHAGEATGQYNGAVYSTGSSNYVTFINSIISANWRNKNGAIYRHSSKKETSGNSRKGSMV